MKPASTPTDSWASRVPVQATPRHVQIGAALLNKLPGDYLPRALRAHIAEGCDTDPVVHTALDRIASLLEGEDRMPDRGSVRLGVLKSWARALCPREQPPPVEYCVHRSAEHTAAPAPEQEPPAGWGGENTWKPLVLELAQRSRGLWKGSRLEDIVLELERLARGQETR